ncbi:hypothetical protein XH79_38480 [Bradyrhizobium sp. CCBAU 45389]|nr:hypothetical protein [Bradyrhizobium sp. CCBAU 45389]
MGSMRLGGRTLAFATSFGPLVAVMPHAIRNATESRFFMLFSPFEQASCEPLCRDYTGGEFLGK